MKYVLLAILALTGCSSMPEYQRGCIDGAKAVGNSAAKIISDVTGRDVSYKDGAAEATCQDLYAQQKGKGGNK